MSERGSAPVRSKAPVLHIEIDGRRWSANSPTAYDLSIPLRFDGSQPVFFSAPPAHSAPYRTAGFAGEVAAGASCNCATLSLTPHCNGTHTECVGHITRDPVAIRDIAPRGLMLASLISVRPALARDTKDALGAASTNDDSVIDAQALAAAMESRAHAAPIPTVALIVRTLPNTSAKQSLDYAKVRAPYLTVAAAAWLVSQGIDHLLVDLPSIDRADDNGALAAHRLFWGLPTACTDAKLATRPYTTITEMCFIDDSIPDGGYLLNLQIAPFMADAAPSRPIVYPLLAH